MMVERGSTSAAFQRSMASDRARRTRASSNGFFLVLKVMSSELSQGLSCTVILLPSAPTSRSRSPVVTLRKSAMICAPCKRVDECGALREDGVEAVEIGQVRLEVVLEALALPMRAGDVLGELEGTGAHHVARRKGGVLLELGGAEDAVERVGEGIEQRAVGPLQLEDDGQRIGRLDAVDVGDQALAHRHHALRRIAQAIVGRLDVLGRERRAVVELDVGAELEGVGLGVVGNRPALGQVAHRPLG